MCLSRAPRQATKLYLDALLPPVLHCLDDPESRVRYYACESLYNIAKVRPVLPCGGALCIVSVDRIVIVCLLASSFGRFT